MPASWRVAGWHVDDFGALRDVGADRLPDGMVVLLGPNASGKSTLLAFLQRTLFGHPHRNRRDVNHYEPVSGAARRGGRVWLRDDAGRDLEVERHAGPRPSCAARLGDRTGGEELLAEVLGTVDADLFSSLHAFGLDELRSLSALPGDRLRDRLRTAGTRGAGRSAREATAALEQRARELWTPNSRTAPLDRVRAELDEVEEAYGAARAEAADHPQRQRREARAAEELAELDERRRHVQTEQRRLDALLAAWPDHARLEAAEERCERLRQQAPVDASVSPAAEAGAPAAGEARLLALDDDRGAQRERLRQRVDAGEAEASAGADLEEALAGLGDHAALVRSSTCPTDPEAIAAAERWSAHRVVLEQELADARRAAGQAEREVAEARAHEQRVSAELRERFPEPPPTVDALAQARDALAALQQTEAERAGLAAHTGPERGWRLGAAGWALLAGVLVAAMVVGALGAWPAALGLALGAGAALLAVRSLTRGGPDPSVRERLAALERTGRQLRAELDLPADADPATLARRSQGLGAAERERAALDALEHDRRRAARDAEAVAARRDAAAAERADLERRLEAHEADRAAWCRERGLEPVPAPGALPGLLRRLADARATARTCDHHARRRAALDEEIDAWAGEAAGLLDIACPADGPGHEALLAAVRDAAERQRALRAAERERRRADEALRERLAAGPEPGRLRAALATADPDGWRARRDACAEELERLEREREQAHERWLAVRAERRDLEASEQLAELAQRRERLLARRDALVAQWRSATAAAALIDATLAAYEAERQPAVLRAAGQLLAEVTDGAHLGLVAEDDDLRVLDAAGRRWPADTLSRGTAEQCYLCLRLALLDDLADRQPRLPMVMDDVLVNVDPARAARLARLLGKAAGQGQLLYLTCHPATAELLAEHGGAVHELADDGRVARR